jgi:hypothetical protein
MLANKRKHARRADPGQSVSIAAVDDAQLVHRLQSQKQSQQPQPPQQQRILTCAQCLSMAANGISPGIAVCAMLLAIIRGLGMVASAQVSIHNDGWSFIAVLEWQLMADIVTICIGSVSVVAVRATMDHHEEESRQRSDSSSSSSSSSSEDEDDDDDDDDSRLTSSSSSKSTERRNRHSHRSQSVHLTRLRRPTDQTGGEDSEEKAAQVRLDFSKASASAMSVESELMVSRPVRRIEKDKKKKKDDGVSIKKLVSETMVDEWTAMWSAWPFAFTMTFANLASSACSFIALATISPSTVQAFIEAGAIFSAFIQVMWGGIGPSMLHIVSCFIAVFAAAQSADIGHDSGSGLPMWYALFSSLARAQFIVAQRATVSAVSYGTSTCCNRPPLNRPIVLHGYKLLRATVLGATASAVLSVSMLVGMVGSAKFKQIDIPHLQLNGWTVVGALAQIAAPIGRLLTDFTGQAWLSLCASVFTLLTVNVLSITALNISSTFAMWSAAALLALSAMVRSYDVLASDTAIAK